MIIGLLVGIAIAYIIVSLLHKSKNVSRTIFDDLNNKFNEANTQLRIRDEKLSILSQSNSELNNNYSESQHLVRELSSQNSSLQTSIANNEAKISELSDELLRQNQQSVALQNDVNKLLQSLSEVNANNNSLADSLAEAKEKIAKLETNINETTHLNNELNKKNSTLIANNQSLEEKLSTQKEEILQIQRTSQLQFEQIANKILEEKSGKFTEVNKANIEAILKPLGENISNFKQKVEDTYNNEARERFSLGERVKELMEQTNKVSAEANNLASALKGSSKTQGNWGEMILESILDHSGLTKGREYLTQSSDRDEDGKIKRPDVKIILPKQDNDPNQRIIIIDSKVSLTAYERYSSSDDPEEQAIQLKAHINSIYAHVNELSNKKYDDNEEALDFVMMFIPIEPAYLLAINNDSDLWSKAYDKRIVLISPSNLIVSLKLVEQLWKRELQSKNAKDIVKRGEALYDKFVGFTTTFESIGKSIESIQKNYDAASKQLNSGNGNLVRQAQMLKELGLKTNKEITGKLLPLDEDNDTEQKLFDN